MSAEEIRKLVKLVDSITEGVVERDEIPQFFYHGTNPLAATMIFQSGCIDADNPVDDDDLGAVVCVTSEFNIGRMFAIEFERCNSQFDVGFVFELDAAKVMESFEAFPYEAETASIDEKEYRIDGDIPLRPYCTGIKIVGDKSLLTNKKYLQQMHKSGCKNFFQFGQRFGDFDDFLGALKRLCTAAS
jgi:hypothetical protein